MPEQRPAVRGVALASGRLNAICVNDDVTQGEPDDPDDFEFEDDDDALDDDWDDDAIECVRCGGDDDGTGIHDDGLGYMCGGCVAEVRAEARAQPRPKPEMVTALRGFAEGMRAREEELERKRQAWLDANAAKKGGQS